MVSLKQPIPKKPVRFTPEQYFYLSEQNRLGDGRTELINGEIISMPSQYDDHAWGVSQAFDVLRELFPRSKYWVRSQMTLHCGSHVPEPDLAVTNAPAKPSKTYMTGDRALMVIEIADATLIMDTRVKPAIYASEGIREYWVLDLPGRQLIVHRNPVKPVGSRTRPRYESVTILNDEQFVSPLAVPKRRIKVAKLLP